MTSAIEEPRVTPTAAPPPPPMTLSIPPVPPPAIANSTSPNNVFPHLQQSHPHPRPPHFHPHSHLFANAQSPITSLHPTVSKSVMGTANTANGSMVASIQLSPPPPLHQHSQAQQQQHQHLQSLARSPVQLSLPVPVTVPPMSMALPLHVPATPALPPSVPIATPSATAPLQKRRRGGRRAANPQISVEERKRQRVLKNRESAMRSLAKKAEFSAMLERKQANTLQETKTAEQTLRNLLSTARATRPLLDNVPEDISLLIQKADTVIAQAGLILTESDRTGQDSSDHLQSSLHPQKAKAQSTTKARQAAQAQNGEADDSEYCASSGAPSSTECSDLQMVATTDPNCND